MNKQIHCFFNGRVQGVGFRFTAQNLAEKFRVKGWVRNLSVGDVELVAQADEEVLKQYTDSLKQYFRNYITDVKISWEEPAAGLNDFEVKF